MLSSLVARTAALTLAIYFTNRVGIWGNTDASDKLCERISHGLEPMRQLTKSKVRKCYDLSVREACQLAQQLPVYTQQLIKLTKSWHKFGDNFNACNVQQDEEEEDELHQQAARCKNAAGFHWLPAITAGEEANELHDDCVVAAKVAS
ncbi:hypothetical protein KR215_003985 [Drosophila sulfurigaster]|nr:hypothetical protein KR215_003985 [Drosophila sulfurigaster]